MWFIREIIKQPKSILFGAFLLSFAPVVVAEVVQNITIDEGFLENEVNTVTESGGFGLTITGNQEFPKSLIIVPWKNPELGELLGKSFESLIEKEENFLDRDEYLRELAYERVKSRPLN